MKHLRFISVALFLLGLLFSLQVLAGVGADFGKANGGSVRFGNDSGACNASKDGAIRYSSAASPRWQYCNGSTWTAFATGSTSISYCKPAGCFLDSSTPSSSGSAVGCLSHYEFRWGTVTDNGTNWRFADPEIKIDGTWRNVANAGESASHFCHELGRPRNTSDYDWFSANDTTRVSAAYVNGIDMPYWYHDIWGNNFAADYFQCEKSTSVPSCPAPSTTCKIQKTMVGQQTAVITVPAGCTVQIKAWGAGGGAGGGEDNCGGVGSSGGGGGYATITEGPLASTTTYYLAVGGAGGGGTSRRNGSGGDSGSGITSHAGGMGGDGNASFGAGGGGGGGATGAWTGSFGGTPVVVAGGGGGGTGAKGCSNGVSDGSPGGSGTAAATTAGGAGADNSGAGWAGGGGGGGGGYTKGGAGGAIDNGGAGGANYAAAGGSTTAGSTVLPGNFVDANYVQWTGLGGSGIADAKGNDGVEGMIYFRTY